MTGGSRSARWDLRITPGAEDAVKLLTERAYKARIPTAKTTVRHPLAQFDGQVELDDVRLVLDGWTGSVNHNWGTRHTPAYAFGQVCGFDDAPDSSLEIVTARAAIGPFLLPAATLFVFRHAGRGIRGALDPGQPADARPVSAVLMDVRGRVGDQMIEGEITAEPPDVIGLTYTDTDGGSKYCYNSAIATCRIQVAGKAFERTRARSPPGARCSKSSPIRATTRCPCWPSSVARDHAQTNKRRKSASELRLFVDLD